MRRLLAIESMPACSRQAFSSIPDKGTRTLLGYLMNSVPNQKARAKKRNLPGWSVLESNYKLTKYNTQSYLGTVDNKTALDIEDDVAHVKLGGGWRMPTIGDWDELRNNCSWTWTTRGGVKGYLVTSYITLNSIFLPAAGYKTGTGSD